MCHHVGDAYTVWRDERESEGDADDEEPAEPAEVDIAEPEIGETEVEEPEIEQPRLDD
jgi:hypothetical protein